MIIEKYHSVSTSQKFLIEKLQVVDPRNFRKELAKFFETENRFKIQTNDDPIELLFFIINCLHSYSIKAFSLKNKSGIKCKPDCVAHKNIWLELVEEHVIKLNMLDL